MGVVGAPPPGTAQVPVPFRPLPPAPPQAQLSPALPLGPWCPQFPATALLGLVPSFPETVGSARAGLGLSWSAQHWCMPALHKWCLRMSEGMNNKATYSQHPSPPHWLQPHLLFFRFGFLGTCSQGFLKERGRGSEHRAWLMLS